MAESNLHQNINRLLRALHSAEWLNALGLNAIRIIRKRTFSGVDVYGKKFQDYSEPYAKKRTAAGLLNHPVNMEFTTVSGMMDSIDHVVNEDLASVQLKFSNARAEELAGYHNIQGAGKSKVIRQFFGIAMDSEKQQLTKIAVNNIKKILQNMFKG